MCTMKLLKLIAYRLHTYNVQCNYILDLISICTGFLFIFMYIHCWKLNTNYTYFFYNNFIRKINLIHAYTCIIERNCIYLQTKKKLMTIFKKGFNSNMTRTADSDLYRYCDCHKNVNVNRYPTCESLYI